MAKQCPCPDPPGGYITCDDNQFGMCAYVDGERRSGCLNVPVSIDIIIDSSQRNLAVINWVLTTLTGVGRNWDAVVEDADTTLLASGEFVNSHGQLIRFSLPDSLDLAAVRVKEAALIK
jgi:hypothetical protein